MQDDSPSDPSTRRILRRETAIELPKLSFKATTVTTIMTENTGKVNVIRQSNLLTNMSPLYSPILGLNRNRSADQAYVRSESPVQQNYLLPSMSEPSNPANYYKKSFESLHKNSSTDTEYSIQPYKAVKQSSNDTSTSLTGSLNVDQAFTGAGIGLETSLDGPETIDSSLNQTVIDNQAYDPTKTTNGSRTIDIFDTEGCVASTNTNENLASGSRSLKKQFSLDQGLKVTGQTIAGQSILAAVEEGLAPPLLTKTATPCASPLSRGFHYLRESSSTSTEEFKEDHGYQSQSADTEQKSQQTASVSVDDGESIDNCFNETMC